MAFPPVLTKQHDENCHLAQRRAKKRAQKVERGAGKEPCFDDLGGKTTKKLTSASTPSPLMVIPPGKFEATNPPPVATGALGEVFGEAGTGRGSCTCATGKPCWWGGLGRGRREGGEGERSGVSLPKKIAACAASETSALRLSSRDSALLPGCPAPCHTTAARGQRTRGPRAKARVGAPSAPPRRLFWSLPRRPMRRSPV